MNEEIFKLILGCIAAATPIALLLWMLQDCIGITLARRHNICWYFDGLCVCGKRFKGFFRLWAIWKAIEHRKGCLLWWREIEFSSAATNKNWYFSSKYPHDIQHIIWFGLAKWKEKIGLDKI